MVGTSSKRYLEAARKNLESELFYVCAFLSQQAVEKGLKALYIHTKKKDARFVVVTCRLIVVTVV